MSVEQTLHDALANYAPLSDLIATGPCREKLPQNPVFPALAYCRISTTRVVSHRPDPNATAGWCRFQLDWWADGPHGGQKVLTIREAVLGALGTFNASAEPASPTPPIDQAPNFVVAEQESIEPRLQQPLSRYRMDVMIFYGAGQ